MKRFDVCFVFVLLLFCGFGSGFESSYCDCYDGMDLKSAGTISKVLRCTYYYDDPRDSSRDLYASAGAPRDSYDPIEEVLAKKTAEYAKWTDGTKESERIETIDNYADSEKARYISKDNYLDTYNGHFFRGYRDYRISIRMSGVPRNILSDFEEIEKCMVKAIDADIAFDEGKEAPKEEGLSLKLEHENPFPYLSEDAWISSRDSMIGGELRATVLDEDGDEKSGELVVFYTKKGDSLNNILRSRDYRRFPGSTTTWRELYGNIEGTDVVSYIGYGVSDKNGVAKMNYISRDGIDMQKLSARMVLEKGEVSGKVYAGVVDLKKKAVEVSSSVDVKFDHIARIVDISGKGVPDVFPGGLASGPGQVRVKKVLFAPYSNLEAGDNYELMPGDILNVDAATNIEVVWLNGDRVKFKLPEFVSVKERVAYDNANIVLLSDAYQSGIGTGLEKAGAYFYGLGVDKGISFFVDTLKKEIPGSSLAEKGYDFLVDIIENTGDYKAKDLSEHSIISTIRINSEFLVDYDEDGIMLSVLEGHPDVVNSAGEISLEAGESVVFDDESIGEVEDFDEDVFEDWVDEEERYPELMEFEDNGEGFGFGWLFFWLVVLGAGFYFWKKKGFGFLKELNVKKKWYRKVVEKLKFILN